MKVFVIVIGSLVVGCLAYPKQPTFPSCQSSVCHSGTNTSYGCRDGVCDYTCSKSMCHGFGNAVFPRKGIQEAWGSGALGKQGCYGGNCGYWSGCNNGKCSDFYDFQQCQHVKCVNGSFHGYGCSTGGNCRVVCFIDVCHSVDNYGKMYQPTIPAQQKPAHKDNSHKSGASAKAITEFLDKVNPKDLNTLIESTPNIDELITSLDGEAITAIFKKLPNAINLMKKLKPKTQLYILSKLCSKARYALGSAETKGYDPTGICNKYGNGWQKRGSGRGYGVPAYPKMGGGYGHGSFGQAMYPQPQKPYPPSSVSAMDPRVLQSILTQMPNLNQLLMYVDPMLLQSALMYVPGFGIYASSMDPYALQSMFAGLPNIRDILASMDARLLHWMVANTPNIDAILISINPKIAQTIISYVTSKDNVVKEPEATTSKPASEVPDPANITDPKTIQILLSTVPSIPIHFANILLNKDPGFVQYIIENHQNLPGLLASMNAQTLHYVTAHVPKFGKMLSKMHSNTLKVVFDKLPNTTTYLADMDPEVVRAIVAKLPSLSKYAPTEPTTTAPPTTPTSAPKVETIVTVPTTVATEAPIFTDKELEILRSKIPLFDTVLKLMDSKKVAALRVLPKKLKIINSYLSDIKKTLDAVKDALFEAPLSKLKKSGGVFGPLIGLLF
uniref:Expressed conserved protein n=1 Tax=Echinococcus granulosus TaxID=6210 RepID=A0A068WVZ0_ECHGR|nr:expressed conserved protein [Echinococcus granulosus]